MSTDLTSAPRDRREFLVDAGSALSSAALAASVIGPLSPATAAAEASPRADRDRELMFLPAYRQREMVVQKEISSLELTEAALRRIDALNGQLHAFITVDYEGARLAARAADAAVQRSKSAAPLGPLHGVPISIKDLESTKGLRTTFGSTVFKEFVPERDSVVVERVRKSGAVILGKTNTPEFGSCMETYNKLLPPCANPWNPSRTSGGSSGGAAVGIASGMSAIAVGGDGGGSIRFPAHFTGIFGLKPTKGRIPRWGGIGKPANNSGAVPGPLSRTVRDAAILLQALAGHDPRDATSSRQAVPDYGSSLKKGVRGLRIGWSADLGFGRVEPATEAALKTAAQVFAALNARVEEAPLKIDPPPLEFPWAIRTSDELAAFEDIVKEHRDELMPYVLSRLDYGARVTGAQYSRALRQLDGARSQLEDYFQEFDLLLVPNAPCAAPRHHELLEAVGGKSFPVIAGVKVAMYQFTVLFNLTGNPAATLPVDLDKDRLPIGVQLVGRLGDEGTLLGASAAFEEARPWSTKHPPIS